MKKTFLLKTLVIACVASFIGGGKTFGGTNVILYQTGFESSDGFTASTTYNNTTLKAFGPENSQWSTICGTPSTNSAITGSASLQLRYYKSNGLTPYTTTDFLLDNVIQLKFNAINTNTSGTSNLTVQHTTDDGVTWSEEKTYSISATKSEVVYDFTTPTDNVKFKISWKGTTDKKGVCIDDVIIYGQSSTGKNDAGIKYETTEYTVNFGETFEKPTLKNPNGLTVSYSISCTPEGVADIDADGNVTINDIAGKATVTATSAETDTYDKGVASYTITVKDPFKPSYTKITSSDDLIIGAKYIIVNETNKVALGLINSESNGEPTDITLNGTTAEIESDNNATNPYEITLGGETDNYTLMTAQCPDGFGVSGNKTFSTTANKSWKITFTTQENATIANNLNGNEIRYNKDMNKFRIYEASSGTLRVQLYKKVEPQFTINEEKFSTFYSDKAYVMPEGVDGGIITAADNTNGTLTIDYKYKAGETVPAKTALLLKGEAKTYTYAYTTQKGTPAEGNLLHGADAVDADGKTFVEGTDVKYYILSHNQAGTGFGFYWAAADGAAIEYKAPYAFLAISTNGSSAAPKMFTLGEGEGTTSIDNIRTEATADNRIYTVTGAYAGNGTSNLPKGLYIKNGKKIIVK